MTRVETLILSDLHLADAEPVDPARPHWKAYKQRRLFIDADFARLLEHTAARAEGPVELVLNGDVFDFDIVTRVPERPPAPVDWVSRLRGLGSEEWMSQFKMDCILADHPQWCAALAAFVRQGHKAVFVIGNHDMELHWPSVQERLRAALELDAEAQQRVVFCNWFYLSDGDTYVSHGHQYDPYCTAVDPIDPLIAIHGRPRVRIPFGDMANRYMLNGMGYFNPHLTSNYIMTAGQYARFFVRYLLRAQPLMLWTWFWSAMVTLALALREFWRPALRDPLMVDEKVQAIAERSQATPSQVRRLHALHLPSACTRPWLVARELWLDRGLLFLGMVYAAWQLVLAVNFVVPIRSWWVLLPIALLFPPFLHYSFKVRPAVFHDPLLTAERAQLLQRITGVRHAVFGHTHEPVVQPIGPLLFANCGFWSPAFSEPECRNRVGTQTFVWLRPGGVDGARSLTLWEWPPGGLAPRPVVAGESVAVAEPEPARPLRPGVEPVLAGK